MRWATAPLGAVDRLLPATGDILDLGCGQGVLVVRLATSSSGRRVVGIDLDERRVAAGRSAAARAGVDHRVRFEVGRLQELPPGPWDGVAVVDVLYLLPLAEQEAVVRDAARALAAGGVLVVKETAPRPRWKAVASALQEHLAVGALRLTRSEGGVHRVAEPDAVAGWLRSEGLAVEVLALDRGYHVPHAAVVGRRVAESA